MTKALLWGPIPVQTKGDCTFSAQGSRITGAGGAS